MVEQPRPVALITGASSGIGAIFAQRLAERGFDLVLVARREARLRSLGERLQSRHGTTTRSVAADLTDDRDIRVVEQLLASDQTISMLVNNAGISRVGPVAGLSEDHTLSQIELNVVAPVRLIRAALPGMLSRGAGAIVNVGSALAVHGYPGASIYSGTKAFLLMYSRGLQAEVEGTGVQVQVVLPATVATELYDSAGLSLSDIPADQVMAAEDMVDAALAGFDRKEQVTLPSVDDAELWSRYDDARGELFAATQTGTPATRYRESLQSKR